MYLNALKIQLKIYKLWHIKKLLCVIYLITFVCGSFGPQQEKWPNNAQCTLSLIRDGVTLSDRNKKSQ